MDCIMHNSNYKMYRYHLIHNNSNSSNNNSNYINNSCNSNKTYNTGELKVCKPLSRCHFNLNLKDSHPSHPYCISNIFNINSNNNSNSITITSEII